MRGPAYTIGLRRPDRLGLPPKIALFTTNPAAKVRPMGTEGEFISVPLPLVAAYGHVCRDELTIGPYRLWIVQATPDAYIGLLHERGAHWTALRYRLSYAWQAFYRHFKRKA